MHLDDADLIAQFCRDWPTEAELSRLRALVDAQEQEIQRLNALPPSATSYSVSSPRPYVLPTDGQEEHRG